MTRLMADSTNVTDDPLTVQLCAFYADGIYATTAAKVRARFPNAVLVPISAIGSNAGIVGDVEPGCMTPTQAIRWVLMRRAAGIDPSLYVNETYGWAAMRLAFAGAGIPQPHWWVADYDGNASIPAGAVAKQYANPPLTGGHFDLSVVADYWPGVDTTYGVSAGQLSRRSSPRRVIAIATVNGLHQFCRGRADAAGHRQLFHRRRLAGSWSPWAVIGGDGNLGVDDLGAENIAVGVDDLDVIVVTVTGSDGASFFETTSKDNGDNWTSWAGPIGAGDGLVAVSAAPAPPPPAMVITSATLSGELTAPITVTLK